MGLYKRVTGSAGNEMIIKEPKLFKQIELKQAFGSFHVKSSRPCNPTPSEFANFWNTALYPSEYQILAQYHNRF